MLIKFHFQRPITISNRRCLKKIILKIFEDEGKFPNSIDFIFCDNNYLLEINKAYLNHDYFTDIITFDLSPDSKIAGEIYISVEMVRENAIQFQTSFSNELTRVMFHGILHLCGYNDKTKIEKHLMRRMEDHYLKMFHGKL
nr:metal-dependent hydrolase YbeY [uncultured bacterium]